MIHKETKLNNIILFVIDGFGIGSMPDSGENLNTARSIFENAGTNELSMIKKLLDNSFNNFKKISLGYKGADSVLGHLAISGIRVDDVEYSPLSKWINQIINELNLQKFNTRLYDGLIVVNESVVISNNIEAENGLAINVNGCRDLISKDNQLKIANIVRKIVKSSRVISFGAHNVKLDDYLNNVIPGEFVGINTPKTGVYNDSFDAIHIALPFNKNETIQKIFASHNFKNFMYGKFADILNIEEFDNFKVVDTSEVLNKFNNDFLEKSGKNFFSLNIQETDLAGHQNDIDKFINILKIVNNFLENFIPKLSNDDLLIILADHGNDPKSGSSHHSREFVPFITFGKDNVGVNDLNDIKKYLIECL